MNVPPESPGDDRDEDPSSLLLHHRRLIGRRFYVHTWVRAVMVVTIIVGALLARYVLGMKDLDVGALTVLAIWIAAYNTVAWALFRRYRDPDKLAPVYGRLLYVSYSSVVLDFLSLTCAVWLVGGGRSPFTAFYLLHVIVSCILLSRRAALTLTALAYMLLALLIVGEWSGIAPPHLPDGTVAGHEPLDSRHAFALLVIHAMLFSISLFLLLGLARSLRRNERRILLANAELTRLSEQRKNFLHIAVHNLRAPLGAVTMLLENMRRGLAGPVTDKQQDWLDRSLRRLEDLSEFMSNLQTLASLDTDLIRAEFTHVDLTEIVQRLVDEYTDVVEAHRHDLSVEISRPVPPVLGYDRLLREALVNYLTNAVKYTPDGGKIVVRILYRAPMVRVEVTDSGVGISEADQQRLFGEFVRIRSQDPAVAKIKGSGLGLSIVRRIVLAHGGRAGIESELGKGSTFFLELPALHE